MQFHILNENYTPVTVMDNDLPDAINFNSSKFHRFLTGSADFFDFETSKLHVDHNLFQVGYWLAFRYDDRDRLQYINEIAEAESDKMMSISTLSNNLDLNQENTQPFSADIARPFDWYFNRIMYDTGYEIGINEISNLTRKLSWDSEMSHRAFLQSVATQFDNAELDYEVVLNSDFTIKKRLVHIKKKIGEVRDDIELRYGKNIKTVKRSTNIDNLYTAIKPISKDDNDKITDISSMPDWQKLDKNGNVMLFHKKGNPYIYAPQTNARFGNRSTGGYVVYDYSYDKVSQSDLFNRSVAKLEEISVPAINYEVEGRTGAKIGDTVKIVDDGYTPPLILSARVLEQIVSFDDATVEQATFGNYKALQSQISADLIAKMQQLAEENAPYKAVTLTTNGLTFKNSEGSTTLTARLYKGSKEIVPESYEWTIDGVAISGNSEQHEITAEDINGKAVVRWSAVINGVTIAFDEVTITDVSDGTNGISPTVMINPDTSLTIVDFKGTKTTPVLKGSDGVDGTDGIAGKDGVGVKTTVITYAISTSGTTAPTTGWTSSVPSLVKGQYLWTKTVWTYTDNSSETGCSPSYISKDGNNGTDGIAGKDGVGIKTTTITYASHTNGTTAPTTGYTTAVPSVPAGQFLWTKTVWTYTDNSSETGCSVAMMGVKGDKGDQGVQGAQGAQGIKGTDGTNGTNGINGTNGQDAISVVLSNENVTLPANAQGGVTSYANSGTTLSVFVGKTAWSYGTGANKWTVAWSASGATRGSGSNDGTVASFDNISGMSATSGATATQTFVVSVNVGGTVTTFTKVQNISKSEKGITGDDGVDSYTYYRYSPYSDGRNMTSLPNADSKYLGIVVTTSATAPNDNSSYSWSKYAGNDANKYGDNVFFNPKFDNIPIGKVNPGDMSGLGWDVKNPSYLLQPEADSPSEEIIHLDVNDTYLTSKGIPVIPGERYIFSVNIKTTNFGSGNTAPLAFRMYPSSNDSNSFSITGNISEVLVRINGASSGTNLIDASNFQIVNNANWNTRSYVFEIPENVTYIRPLLFHRGVAGDKTKYRKLELRKQQQGAVVKAATEPSYKYVGMQWQYTGASAVTIGGIAIQPSTIYIWSGSVWQLYVMRSTNLQVDNAFITNAMIENATIDSAKIKSINADKIVADSLSALSANLGDVKAGTVKLMRPLDINGISKNFGIYQSKSGILSSGPIQSAPGTLSNSRMSASNLDKGSLTFVSSDYTEDLETMQSAGISSTKRAGILFNSYDNGKDDLIVYSSGNIVFNGITSQDTPWIEMVNGAYCKNMFSRVYISYSVKATSTANIPLGVLPVGLRPFRGLHLTANAWGTTLGNDRHIEVRTTGEVTLYSPANGASYDGEVSFTI